MTCIVLTRNPNGGAVMALTRDEGNNEGMVIADWPTKHEALTAAADHRLVQAWAGWVVDLDNLEVTEV